jgi:hypothetical protein
MTDTPITATATAPTRHGGLAAHIIDDPASGELLRRIVVAVLTIAAVTAIVVAANTLWLVLPGAAASAAALVLAFRWATQLRHRYHGQPGT